jgi:hypothetical protein
MSPPLVACEGGREDDEGRDVDLEADLVEDPDSPLILEYGRCPCANVDEHNSGLRLAGFSDEPAIVEFFA